MTNGELVSRVVNDLKAYTKDSHVSKRWIINIAKNKAAWLLAQRLGDKTVVKEDNLYTTLKCFELCEDNIIDCNIVEFKSCKSLMKSTEKLPEMVYSRLGPAISSVVSLDGKVYHPTSLKRYDVEKNRNTVGKKRLYYVSDGYLYLPDSTTEVVNITLMALDKSEVDKVSGCSDCDECESYWDKEFVVSDKLIEYVIIDTIKEAASTLGIPEDENPNLDSSQRTQITQ